MAKYRDVHFGEIVDAWQVRHDDLPDDAETRAYTNTDGQNVDRLFIDTKDPDGHDDMADSLVDVAEGNWVITHEDGTVSLMADVNGSTGEAVFAAAFEVVE